VRAFISFGIGMNPPLRTAECRIAHIYKGGLMKTWLKVGATAVVASLLTLVAVRAQQRTPSLTALDYVEIQQLVARYAYAIDTCGDNGYDYARLYTPDGVYIDKYSDAGFAKGGVRSEGYEALARRSPVGGSSATPAPTRSDGISTTCWSITSSRRQRRGRQAVCTSWSCGVVRIRATRFARVATRICM